MKSYIRKAWLVAFAIILGAVVLPGTQAFADGDEQSEMAAAATSISISPVSKVLQLEANNVYKDTFKVTNNGSSDMKFEVYAAPYSYTLSESDNTYKLGFNNENNYTQISRWITFKDTSGNYVQTTTFTAAPGETVEIKYAISTPSSIPAGGQYAVLFAHTLSSTTTSSGIKTEASPGLVVYGRAAGETKLASEFNNLSIKQSIKIDNEDKSLINGVGKVKNTGNVDFMASGHLKVTGIFGNVYYETPADSTSSRVSIIPEVELEVSDVWKETPFFGLFNVEWTVSAAGNTETITGQVLILPIPILVLMILLLTIVIVWIIVIIRKRRERRARFSY